jgi:hypothetical protein
LPPDRIDRGDEDDDDVDVVRDDFNRFISRLFEWAIRTREVIRVKYIENLKNQGFERIVVLGYKPLFCRF